jgi:hypothetical protein
MRHLQDGSVSVYPLPLNASENPHIEELPRAFDRPPGRQFFSQSNSSRSDEFNKALRIRDLSMTVLADATGGRLLGKKSLPEAVRAAGADARNGLRLTFSLPQTASDRAVHTIDLTIRGKSNRLMFPHYLYVSQPDGETDDVIAEELQDALGSTRELIAEILLAVLKTGDKTADLWIDPSAITTDGRDAEHAAVDLDIGTSTLSGAFRSLATSVFRLQRSFDGSARGQLEREGLLLHVKFTPHNRARRVRFVVRDRTTGRIGTVDLPLQDAKTAVQ